jgi:hypothetical protein
MAADAEADAETEDVEGALVDVEAGVGDVGGLGSGAFSGDSAEPGRGLGSDISDLSSASRNADSTEVYWGVHVSDGEPGV